MLPPSFRPSPSGAFQPSASATGGPPGIIGFRPPYPPRSTLGLSRPPKPGSTFPPSPPRVEPGGDFRARLAGPATGALGPVITPTTRGAGITAAADTRLAPPAYSPPAFYTGGEKLPSSGSTRGNPVAVSCIAEVSRLLHPIGPGPLSQCPSRAPALTAPIRLRLGGPLPPHQQP